MLLIRCFEAVRVSHESGDTSLAPAQRQILTILAAAGPNGLSSEQFAEELYFDRALPDKWNGAFRQAMNRLRKVVDVVNENGRYRIDQSTQDVDVWQLRVAHQLDLDQTDDVHLQGLLSGDPFPNVDLSPRLSQAVDEVSTLRIEVVQRMLEATRSDWSARTLHAIRTLAAREHYRDPLLAFAVRLHLDAGHQTDAQNLVDTASDYSERELDTPLDPAIRALIVSDSPPTTAPPSVPIDGRVVGSMARITGAIVVPRTQIMQAANNGLASAGVILQGESGAGKTALLQVLADQWAASGNHVLWITGRRGTSAAYAPFLAVAPSLEQDLKPLFEQPDDELLRVKCWAAVRRRLAVEFAGLPLTLVVDDAQWLDSHSQQLVDFVASDTADPPLRLVVAGRNTETPTDWHLFADGLERVGLKRIVVGEFPTEDLVALIGAHHPHSSSKQRQDFAAALVERKAALPLIAQELIWSADPNTLALARRHADTQQPQIWANRIDEPTRRIAAVAAVLGTRFRVSDVATLGEWPLDRVVRATDELQEADILVSEQRPDEFSFRHALIHADFDTVLNRGERRRLHFDSVQLVSGAGAVHQRAIHIVEAGALMASDDVVEAVLLSARAFHDDGSYREAVAAFTQARSISDHEIAPHDLLIFAAALAASGGDSWDIRSTAFDLAQISDDQALSLEIALAGVRRTEDSMGDERRITMLERIVTGELDEGPRVTHASALAREFGLLGHCERALETSGRAVELATTATTRLTAWLGGWAACRSIPPSEWPALPLDRNEVTDPELRTRLALIECAQALVRGDDHSARAEHQVALSHLSTRGNPLHEWHASLATALFAFVDGDWDAHETEANAAVEAASQHGVNAAFSTRAAQVFMRHWNTGRHVDLLPFLEAAPPDLQHSFLAQAALAVTLAQVPERQDEASRLIQDVTDKASEQRSPFSLPAAGLLSSAPPALLNPAVRQRLLGILEPFDGTALVVAAGISHLGPVSRSLANLSAESAERAELLKRASEEADRWRLKLWSVRCRVDLAVATGESALLDRARELAEGTDLAVLVPD